MLRRVLLAVCASAALAACSTAEPRWAPDQDVARAAYVHDGPSSITLVTIYSNRSDQGAHSALLINASERVVFDPAGTWHHRAAPERNDVHHGITDQVWSYYIDYHARETFRAELQTIKVSRYVAEQALLLVQNYGAVPKAHCANATSKVLRELPGFSSLPQTFYPGKLEEGFAKLPGVSTRVIYDDDSDDNQSVLEAQNQL
ncbi:hypothetical protein [Actibacterium pelagium]|nr:hypothetical protein [Actibacterium pelagium]